MMCLCQIASREPEELAAQAQTLALKRDIVLSKKLAAALKIPDANGADADRVPAKDQI